MIRKHNDYRLEKRAVGGGVGELEFHHKFTKEELYSKCRVCSEITLQPGESIGRHKHEVEAEIYYMLSGQLISIDGDGNEEPFETGDMMVTGGGDSHAVRNDSDAPATLLAIVIL